MNQQPSRSTDQSLNITGSILEGVQIGGVAGRDLILTQIQGGIHITNVFESIGVIKENKTQVVHASQQDYRWRKGLLDKVKTSWIDGVLRKSLHSKAVIELGLEDREDLIVGPASEAKDPAEALYETFPNSTEAVSIFESIGTGRTLLILGEPGSGKTVTLLKLAESLILRAKDNLSHPLPVVLNLSSWGKKRQSIATWLIQELHELYQIPKSLSKTWIAQEQLILLLDGLDEIRADYQNDCVKALNIFIRSHGLTEVVVCSRIHDYELLAERLRLRSAVYVKPLTKAQVNQFLISAGDSLSALRTVLEEDTELQTFATSPLILSIMALAYQDSDKAEILVTNDKESRYKIVFNSYIERMFQRRGAKYKYSKQEACQWLSHIARKMLQEDQTVFLIERLQPNWLGNHNLIFLYRLTFAGMMWFLVGKLVFLPFLWSVYSEIAKVFFEIQSSITLDLAGLILSIWLFGLPPLIIGYQIEPLEFYRWSWEKATKSFVIVGLTTTIIFFIFLNSLINFEVIEASDSIFSILLNRLRIASSFGLVVGFIFGITRGLADQSCPMPNNISARPNQGIWNSFRAAGVFAIVAATSLSLGAQLNTEFFSVFSIIAIFGFFLLGGITCLKHLILRILLFLGEYGPWNYNRFLNAAIDITIVQRVGSGYIFVHRMLLEHFAQMEKQI